VCSVSLSFFLLYRVWYSFIASFATPFVSRASLNALIAFSPLIFLTSCLFSSTCHSLSLPLSLSLSLSLSPFLFISPLLIPRLLVFSSFYSLFSLSFYRALPQPRTPRLFFPVISRSQRGARKLLSFLSLLLETVVCTSSPLTFIDYDARIYEGFRPFHRSNRYERQKERKRGREREREREKVHYSFLPAIIRPFICKLDKNRRHLIEMYLTWVEKSIRIRLSAI